jgi:hypothetical protein
MIVGVATFFLLIIFVFAREYWEVRVKNEDNAARIAQLNAYFHSWWDPFRKIIARVRRTH